MAQASNTFRVFVSSTFSDLKEERNALQQHVFPRLRELCTQYGCRFQAIDLRWGVSEEAALDQQTMNICLQELERCKSITPRPNFIVLLGDRYGWHPLPPQIEAQEFEAILDRVSPVDRELLLWDEHQPDDKKGWYRRDENAVSAECCLRPREVNVPDNANEKEKQAALDREAKEWGQIEKKLRSIILRAIDELGWSDDDPRRIKYEASATHQEILHGALGVPDAHEHVYCFFRQIKDLPEDGEAKDFVDLDGSDHLNREAHDQLESLKQRLRDYLPGNFFEYKARWTGDGITTDHLDRLCDDVYNALSQVIIEKVKALEEIDALKKENEEHEAFGQERARFFIGRTESLQDIQDYLEGTDVHPLAIFGKSGSGKTALMARAVQSAREAYPDAQVVSRFIGSTPSSADGRSLLENLCRQISRCYRADESTIPTEYQELVQEFPNRLALATQEKPLILFLDALDQLSNTDNARNLSWLPANLPENVRLIVSSLPSECLSVLENKLPKANIVELEPMPPEEGGKLLNLWLEDAGRTLQAHQWDEVLGRFEQCRLPLYLKLAFEEARLWKSYTEKTELSQDIPGVISDLFGRLSLDANHGKITVSRSLGYLAAAKNGLSEDELLDVLSRDRDVMADFKRRSPKSPKVKTLPVVIWSRLYFELEPYLTERTADGTSLMAFYHPTTFGQEVIAKYLAGDTKQDRHCALAQYFGAQALHIEKDEQKAPNLRKLSEIPYQQAHAELWDDLVNTLMDFDFIETKVRVVGVWPLINDYEEGLQAGYKDKNLSLVQEALRLSSHVLIKDSNQIAGQLIGRLLPYYSFSTKSLIDRAIKWKGAPWLRPLTSRLIMPGGALHCTLIGHTGTVLSIAITSDGNFAVSGGMDGTLRVWDLNRWKMSHSLDLPVGIGDKLLGTLKGTGSIGGLQVPLGFPEEISAPTSMVLTPDGRYAIFSVSKDRTVWMWDMQKNRLSHILKGHSSIVYAVAITPDAKYAVSGSADGTLLIWDLHQENERELRPVHVFTKHDDIVTAVDITKDGRYAVSGSWDKTIRVWDIENRKLVRTIHTGRPVWGLVVAHDTQRVVSRSIKTIDIWNINQGVSWLKGIGRKGMLNTLTGHGDIITALAVTPDGKRVISASADKTLKVWDLERGKFLFNLTENLFDTIIKIVVTPDGHYALTGSDSQTIQVWNLNSLGDVQHSTDHIDVVRTVAVTPDGRLALSGSLDNLIKVWDLERKRVIHTLTGHTDAIMTVAVTGDGKYAVSGSKDKTVKVWDLKQGKEIHNLIGHHDKVNSVAVTGDGKYAVSGSRDGMVKIWDVENGKLLKTYIVGDEVGALALTMDGKRMLTASADESDKTIRIWDLELGFAKIMEMKIKKILDKTIRIRDLGPGKRFRQIMEINKRLDDISEDIQPINDENSHIRILDKNTEFINTIAITQDGSFAVTGGMQGTLKVWDLNEIKEIRTLQGASKSVWSVSITPEGRPLLLTTEGQNLKIWDMKKWDIIASFTGDSDFLSCAIACNGLTSIAGDTMGQVHIFRLEGLD